ncbi:Uncharacterised protein [Mycobacteroides abscessus subsp. abscessus]|nr:Uncharacterised protein [Mycobacteroides abscessus subsp. abscessus]
MTAPAVSQPRSGPPAWYAGSNTVRSSQGPIDAARAIPAAPTPRMIAAGVARARRRRSCSSTK